jgi:hypothetical protein
MSTVALSGNDAVIINNRIFADFADGDVADLTFPNDIMGVKTGKNGNSIYAFNATGRQCEFKIRLIRSSADDKFLNDLLSQQISNPQSFTLMIGQFIKKIGDGAGNVAADTYILSGGVFQKIPEGKSSAEGVTDPSVIVYMFKFTNAPRVIT